ncbi:efflux RND transporter periplasmic adaptor subunit [Chryseobacterium sp. SC28]|uniref:efflux RND transporter periplasmic adaptor subunit n=1 Tax=Chryseobacterium sp. SC28 TaxID=2268028 RepID=UPI000F64E67F|nr:HlyD family efflux transporter periplasmic adaptor subunit [Chryseobacterium sp. SC28]RRQ46851.1 HlyD family efflux transporter periplasmic adaptor subunit [Chryseobacterium sp. SC28]
MNSILKYSIIASLGVFVMSCSNKEKTSPVRKDIKDAVFGNGFVEQEDEYIISSTTGGILTDLWISEGQYVHANALVAKIKSDVQSLQLRDAEVVHNDAVESTANTAPELAQVEAQISQARQQLLLDKTNYERYRELKQKNSVSQLDLDKAELQYKNTLENVKLLEQKYDQTKDDLSLAALRSSIQVDAQQATLGDFKIITSNAGKVIEVHKKKGELVKVGDPIAKIGSGSFVIKLYISEDDISKVATGQKVAVHLNTYPHQIFSAKISKILPGFNEEEQSYEAEAKFDSLPPTIFSGTQLQVNIETGYRKNVLTIPTSYISKGQYVTLEDGTQKAVTIGSQNNEWTEILAGISEKDVIVRKKED